MKGPKGPLASWEEGAYLPRMEKEDGPPEGFHWEWTTEGEALDWRLATPIERETYRCRWTDHGKRCPNKADAALNRGQWRNRVREESWWFYCASHLYGRRIRDGAVEHRRLVKDLAGEFPVSGTVKDEA